MEHLIARFKNEMIRRKGVAMYIALFLMGSLLILASQFVRPRGDEQVRAELVELITDAQSIRAESQSLLERVKTVASGNLSLLNELLDYQTHFNSVDTRIKELASRLPGELEQEQQGVAKAELAAQARATKLAASIRPKVVGAFALIRATIAQAALQRLVRVESVSDPTLRGPVMMSAGQFRGRSGSLHDSELVISFNQNWRWNVHLVPGHVQSASNLAYPMLHVTENGTILATVGFDANTADLTISTSDATSPFAQRLDVLKREYQQEELVANAILELLQDAKDRRSTD